MKDVIIIPAHYRPEFLSLCLEHILEAVGGGYQEIRIYHDRHVGDDPALVRRLPEVHEVLKRYKNAFESPIKYVERVPHRYKANPFNFLEAYHDAYKDQDVRYVYLVEEDVFVGSDFFQWHEAIMELEDPFISVGWHNLRALDRDNHPVKPLNDSNAYIKSYRDFSSIGLCWKRENLAPLVRHAKKAYYENQGDYLHTAFPYGPLPRGLWTEQAGLITRLLHETKDRAVIFPAVARVGHVGIHGYHNKQGKHFPGDLDMRIRALREAAQSTEKLVALSGRKDVNAIPDVQKWSKQYLYCSQTVPYVEGQFK